MVMTSSDGAGSRHLNQRTRLALERRAERERRRLVRSGNERDARIWAYVYRELVENSNSAPLEALNNFRRIPVTIDEFVESTEFLGNVIEVWPSLMDDVRHMNPDVLCGEVPVDEVLLGGAIGYGKTTLAIITVLYQIYVLTCLETPQSLYNLAPATALVFPLQSVTPLVTRRNLAEPLRQYFEAMPYTQRHVEWNRDRRSTLEIQGNIKVSAEVANLQAVLGQAIITAVLDEVNFMDVVARSTRVPGPHGLGGRYDQAEELHYGLLRRIRSRTLTQAFSFGRLISLSSVRFEGDFLSRRIAEVARLEEPNVVVVQHKRFEVAPQEQYSGAVFSLQVGNEHHPTRILSDNETVPPGVQVEQVPIEYRLDFQRDPENALRDICGIATSAIHPFIAQRHKIVEAIETGHELGLQQWVYKADVDLAIDGFPQWNEAAMPADRDQPRFIHIDLSLRRDRCGIAIVKWAGMVHVADSQNPECVETLPQFAVETAITIQPSSACELDIGELRTLLIQLGTYYGFNIRQVTFDGFQSAESIQSFRRAGIRADVVSVDRTTEPYDHLRRVLYQSRVAFVDSEILLQELAQLEFNEERRKIDHPPRGSKDLADAVAAALYEASQDRRIRAQTGHANGAGRRPRPATVRRPAIVNRPQGRERPAGRRTRRMSLREQRLERDRRDWQKRFETYVEYEKSRDDVEDE